MSDCIPPLIAAFIIANLWLAPCTYCWAVYGGRNDGEGERKVLLRWKVQRCNGIATTARANSAWDMRPTALTTANKQADMTRIILILMCLVVILVVGIGLAEAWWRGE